MPLNNDLLTISFLVLLFFIVLYDIANRAKFKQLWHESKVKAYPVSASIMLSDDSLSSKLKVFSNSDEPIFLIFVRIPTR